MAAPAAAAWAATTRSKIASMPGCFLRRDTLSGGSSLYLTGESGTHFMRVVRAQPV